MNFLLDKILNRNNYIDIDDENAEYEFINILSCLIDKKIKKFDEIVFLCIGTDRATGDSLGPVIGHKLKKITSYNIYGTLNEPVHAKNLEDTINKIYFNYNNPMIIAIDASLGLKDSVGKVSVKNGSITPGSAVNKNLPNVGDISITGIVNASCGSDFLVLQNTRLNVVMKLAEFISRGIALL